MKTECDKSVPETNSDNHWEIKPLIQNGPFSVIAMNQDLVIDKMNLTYQHSLNVPMIRAGLLMSEPNDEGTYYL